MKKFLIILSMFIFTTDSFATGISGGTSAPCDNDTLNKYTGTANVEINWEPNTISLNWYDGDTKLTVANNSQTCVYDGTLTVPTQPTKPGYTFNGWKVIKVPGGFTELEYLQSSGSQYIDTGIIIQSNYERVVTKVNALNVDSPSGCSFGSQNDDSRDCTIVPWKSSNTNPFGYLAIGTSWYVPSGSSSNPLNTSLNTIYEMDVTADNGRYSGTYCGTAISGNYYGTLNNGISIVIFGFKRNTYVTKGSAKIYYFMLYTAPDTLAFNGIPARRNSDGVLGMYDTITGTFFTNAGTGTFIAGPAVQ